MNSNEKLVASDTAGATVASVREAVERMMAKGVYKAELLRVKPEFKAEADCLLAQLLSAQHSGNEPAAEQIEVTLRALPRESVWVDTIHNVITDVGVHDMLDKYLNLSAANSGVFMGLKGTGTATAAHTQASHAAWLEQGAANAPTYSGTRKTPAFSAAAARAKATSSAVSFTFTGSGTVFGCFINLGGTSAIDNTTGILFSAGDFSGGSKAVVSTDVLNVTWSVTLT